MHSALIIQAEQKEGVLLMEIDYRDMGSRIKKARVRAGLSQEKLAESADVGITHVSHIENGKTIPSVMVLIKIMNRLQISPDELFCGYTDNTQPALIRETAEILKDCSKEELRDINKHIAFVKEMARDRKK
jgi:transcriptional regulator with XRE-family HTH domain